MRSLWRFDQIVTLFQGIWLKQLKSGNESRSRKATLKGPVLDRFIELMTTKTTITITILSGEGGIRTHVPQIAVT
jgi:hypothetical protein